MGHASRFKGDKTPQQLAQDFLNMRVTDLPGISQTDLQHVIDETKEANGTNREPQATFPGDMFGRRQPWHDVELDASSMTVREYMHYAAQSDYYDLYLREQTRNDARKTHGEQYENYIDNSDEERYAERKMVQPLRRYLTLLEELGTLADKGAQQRIPLKPATLENGLEAMEATAKQMHEWADQHMERARSASDIEASFFYSKAGDIYRSVRDTGQFPDWVTDELKARLPLDDLRQRVQDAGASNELEIMRAINQGLIQDIREAVQATLKVDYREGATRQMDMVRPLDAAARIHERLIDNLYELGKNLGIPIRKREVE